MENKDSKYFLNQLISFVDSFLGFLVQESGDVVYPKIFQIADRINNHLHKLNLMQ